MTKPKGELYLIDHAIGKFDITKLKAVKQNKLCDITELKVGAMHFLALKKTVLPAIIDYTPEMLVEWVEKAGFPEC